MIYINLSKLCCHSSAIISGKHAFIPERNYCNKLFLKVELDGHQNNFSFLKGVFMQTYCSRSSLHACVFLCKSCLYLVLGAQNFVYFLSFCVCVCGLPSIITIPARLSERIPF